MSSRRNTTSISLAPNRKSEIDYTAVPLDQLIGAPVDIRTQHAVRRPKT